ncbi:unnamed protein product [Spirodela intermedia]|uniref:Protein kinase domain-containing protein n=1 Tax=Spirodela intermedia TaxID=51605 RepID=A0A7I8JID7_SPIIN|nr:unnamed protein product [Spirodela intermedia]CAA6669917.1 unnamed protein product [Spirodela intermedia]
MTCLSFILKGKKGSQEKAIPPHEDPVDRGFQIFSYKEMKLATRGLSQANKIGEGGFGSVYKGRLRDGRFVAIKVLSSESKQGVREFLSELTTLANIVHENLVSLYGCCVESNQRILVYNYLENNSLAQTLLDNGGRFDWETRVKICVGVARGLAFLHQDVRPHIIHRDIKASNILLDRDMTPKISDFGLAKLIPMNASHVSTRVAGTLGYLAPEYAIKGQLTRKADVYSFGVLLLEIVSGRRNTNTKLPVEDRYLLERVWALYERDELVAIVDPALNGDFAAGQARRFLEVGLLCTQDSLKLRPSMSAAVRLLTGNEAHAKGPIARPGLISDFWVAGVGGKGFASATTESSSAAAPPSSPFSSRNDDTRASFTFTTVADRDD